MSGSHKFLFHMGIEPVIWSLWSAVTVDDLTALTTTPFGTVN